MWFWCIIQEQVMYSLCLVCPLGGGGGGDIVRAFSLIYSRLHWRQTTAAAALLLYWKLTTCRTHITICTQQSPKMLINSKGNCFVFICNMTKHHAFDPRHMLWAHKHTNTISIANSLLCAALLDHTWMQYVLSMRTMKCVSWCGRTHLFVIPHSLSQATGHRLKM